ncbi:MAG: V-type ATP synthase subunit F [Candidatus Yanofskybacteria bacterium CG10_big_fil_rev_8_21_14_0_10_36_16]|uniref:V-type ATP synthase subunit F n=1 Tax=Candidatus Yanofskybacteria bacterium CG10_big_fil_rev_8_21_14_0_10_36_16 TaxID=1975096 RepID=A0A2J0Q7P6_9BACT|nr:MAG: V-type ATP synthase subunit F [Candidatus Yanofskybacteria bacterium CG10_big_fil_rev_8_21_14_0_10_36_16]
MDYKIAIIGSGEAVIGFKALGLDVVPAETIEKTLEELIKLCDSGNYGVIFITEDWYVKLSGAVSELSKRALPALIAVPSHKGSTGAGLANIKKIVEKAVGSDILSN